MLSAGSGSTGKSFHSFERAVWVAVVDLDACVTDSVEADEILGVNVTETGGVCVAGGGTSYRGVGIIRAGVFVGVDVGMEGFLA